MPGPGLRALFEPHGCLRNARRPAHQEHEAGDARGHPELQELHDTAFDPQYGPAFRSHPAAACHVFERSPEVPIRGQEPREERVSRAVAKASDGRSPDAHVRDVGRDVYLAEPRG